MPIAFTSWFLCLPSSWHWTQIETWHVTQCRLVFSVTWRRHDVNFIRLLMSFGGSNGRLERRTGTSGFSRLQPPTSKILCLARGPRRGWNWSLHSAQYMTSHWTHRTVASLLGIDSHRPQCCGGEGDTPRGGNDVTDAWFRLFLAYLSTMFLRRLFDVRLSAPRSSRNTTLWHTGHFNDVTLFGMVGIVMLMFFAGSTVSVFSAGTMLGIEAWVGELPGSLAE